MGQPVYPENTMKRRLRSGEAVNGIICNSASPTLIEIVGYAGFDYVVIETEHSPITLDGEAMHLIRAAELSGLTVLMRISENDPSLIHKALDMGCQGILVTHVNSKEEARRVVESVKFPPLGNRASGPGRHMGRHRYALDPKTYVNYWNQESTVMFLVESMEGVNNLEEIVTVPGIDVIGIGQGDLSAELGAPTPRFGNPNCVKAVEKLLALCKPRGIFVRDIFSDAATAKKWYEKGVRVFEWGFDLGLFQKGTKDVAANFQLLKRSKM